MVLSIKTIVVTVPEDFIEDAIIDTAGYGIGYWASAAQVDSDRSEYAVTEDETGKVFTLTYTELADAFLDLALGNVPVSSDYQEWAFGALQEIRAGEQHPGGSIDAPTADIIVQWAAFGEVVYG